MSDPRFHPSGTKVVATKWFTSSRSLGAGEGWEYPLPGEGASPTSIKAGSGKLLVGRTLPLGWTVENYGEQQVGPEQFIWQGNDSVIYSKNTEDTNGVWEYSKGMHILFQCRCGRTAYTDGSDVHKGTYSIFSTNLTTQRTTLLVDAFPGGATRPELSHHGRTLAFVRRVRDKEALVLK